MYEEKKSETDRPGFGSDFFVLLARFAQVIEYGLMLQRGKNPLYLCNGCKYTAYVFGGVEGCVM